jgi:hypothetical protein
MYHVTRTTKRGRDLLSAPMPYADALRIARWLARRHAAELGPAGHLFGIVAADRRA